MDYGLLLGTEGSDPLVITASRPGDFGPTPVGIYRVGDEALSVLMDTSTELPGHPGVTLDGVSFTGQGGERVLVYSKAGGAPEVFLAGSGAPVGVLSGSQDLPVLGTSALQFASVDLEGDAYVVVGASTGLQKEVVLLGNVTGGVPTPLLAKGDPIPGTDGTVRTFGPAALRDGTVFMVVFDPSFKSHAVIWRDGILTRVAGPGMEVPGVGTIRQLESSFPKPAGGRAHVAAQIDTPGGMVRGILAASPDGIEPLYLAGKLDGLRTSFLAVVAVEEDRLLMLADFVSGGRALYANVGEAVSSGPVLEFTRPASGTLRLTVPPGTVLESAPDPLGGWETVPGAGEVEVDAGAGERYFRLRAAAQGS